MRFADLTLETRRRLAEEAVRGWRHQRAAMALRAVGLGPGDSRKESLEAIAEDFEVSRESVRRARIDLLRAVEETPSLRPGSLAHSRKSPTAEPAVARALRRLLTMTGPLPWDEVLGAWARAQGRHPYLPLPTDTAEVREWLIGVEGMDVDFSESASGSTLIVGVDSAEELDRVSDFLLESLGNQPAGLQRADLLQAAERAGLKPTTIATTLSYHPAVIRISAATWALRGRSLESTAKPTAETRSRRRTRAKPTRFRWADTGALVLEFSMPYAASPVVAVPKTIADLVEGRSFSLEGAAKEGRITVRQARLWGFAPAAGELGIAGGQRVELSLDLLAGTAILAPRTKQEGSNGGSEA